MSLAMSRCLRLGMPNVLIVVEAEVATASAMTGRVEALQRAIAETSPGTQVDVCLVSELDREAIAHSEVMVCPLTLNVPDRLWFPAQKVYQACRDVVRLRDWVQQEFGISAGEGCFWLPVVWTGKGPLYGEAIGVQGWEAGLPETRVYSQPVHLSDAERQRLYELAYHLLEWVGAEPATYLMQFGWNEQEICFDRLWPFPAAPAIASVGVQVPDLFACHWYCLTNLPIYDINIASPVTLAERDR